MALYVPPLQLCLPPPCYLTLAMHSLPSEVQASGEVCLFERLALTRPSKAGVLLKVLLHMSMRVEYLSSASFKSLMVRK